MESACPTRQLAVDHALGSTTPPFRPTPGYPQRVGRAGGGAQAQYPGSRRSRPKHSRPDDAQIRIHHVYPGSIRLDREDRSFEPELVRLIIDRAKLKPDATSAGVDLYNLPLNQESSFTWKK